MRPRMPQRRQQSLDVLQQRFAAAPEVRRSDLALLAARRARRIRRRRTARAGRRSAPPAARGRSSAARACRVRAAGVHADAAEQLPHGAAASSQLHGPVRHLLAADPADQLAQQALVGVEQAVLDVVAAVDPAGLNVGQPTVADEVPGQLCRAPRSSGRAAPSRTLRRRDRTDLAERLDLHRQLPSSHRSAGVGTVVEQHAVVAR